MSDASLKTAGLKFNAVGPHVHSIGEVSGLLGALNARLRTDSAARNLVKKQGGTADLSKRTSTGTYTGTLNEATQARGWPVDAQSGEKWIAIVLTHGSDTEYRSSQWVTKLGSEEIWFRTVSRSTTTGANTATVPWTNQLSAATPLGAGTATAGTATSAARGDHRHPSTATTPATSDDSTAIATTAWVRDTMVPLGSGGKADLAYLPTIEAEYTTTTPNLLVDATALQSTDIVILGRGTDVKRLIVPDFAAGLVEHLSAAMALTAGSDYALLVTSAVGHAPLASPAVTTITGKYLDNNYHSGIQYSIDGGSVWITPDGSHLTLNHSGSGGTYTLLIDNLNNGYTTIKLRLVANNAVITETPVFGVGYSATIAYQGEAAARGGSMTHLWGYMGKGTSALYCSIPTLSAYNFNIYRRTPALADGALWVGNGAFSVPAKAGTYLMKIINNSENYQGTPYVPYWLPFVVSDPLMPSLWFEHDDAALFSQGPHTFHGQWGYVQPSGVEYQIIGGVNHVDFGWRTPTSQTISADGSIVATIPKYDTTTTPAMPANNSWTSLIWRRADYPEIKTVEKGMQP